MRSRAHVKAHPIHPALIPFPFAFLTGATLFDIAARVLQSPALELTSAHLTLAGIAAGLIAAIPGTVDYFYTVPPRSSGQRRARTHALFNVAALGLFAAAFAVRSDDWRSTWPALGLEALGAMAIVYAGWLGGTLVSRNLISVDHRYARAGKWQEEHIDKDRAGVVLGHVDDLQDDQMKLLHIGARRIVLGRSGGRYTAFEDRCTHRGGSLAGGVLIDGTVQCLWHGSQFDTRTGEVRCGPAKQPIRAYEVKVDGDRLILASPLE